MYRTTYDPQLPEPPKPAMAEQPDPSSSVRHQLRRGVRALHASLRGGGNPAEACRALLSVVSQPDFADAIDTDAAGKLLLLLTDALPWIPAKAALYVERAVGGITAAFGAEVATALAKRGSFPTPSLPRHRVGGRHLLDMPIRIPDSIASSSYSTPHITIHTVGGHASLRTQLSRLRVLCAAVAGLPEDDRTPEELSDLARAQFVALHAIAAPGARTGDLRFARTAEHVLERCIRSDARFLAAYAVLVASPANDDVAGPAVRLLVFMSVQATTTTGGKGASPAATAAATAASTPGAWTNTLQPALLDAAMRTLFSPNANSSGGGARVSAASLAWGYSDLLATVTPAQLASILLPALNRALKSRAEATWPIAAALLRCCRRAALPESGASPADDAGALLAAAVAAAGNGSTTEELRGAAVELLGALCERSADETLPCRAVAAVADILLKKKASVPLWQSRLGLTRALEVVVRGAHAAAPSQDGDCIGPKVAAEALATLVAAVPKETHDLVKCAGLQALGVALAGLSSSSSGKPSNSAAAAAAAIPADAAALLAKGLQAYTPIAGGGGATGGGSTGGAPLVGDGYAEAVYVATVALCPGGPPGAAASPPVAHATARGLAASEEVVTALLDTLGRAAAIALASKKALPLHAAVPAVFAMAALQRLAKADDRVAARLSATLIGGDGASASSSGGSGGAVAKAVGAGVGAVKKPAAVAGAAKPKPTPAIPSASSLAGAGKTYDAWDVLTSSAIAPLVLFSPAVVGVAGRSAGDVRGLEPVLLALTDAVVTAMATHADALGAYPKALLSGVLSDLTGASAGDVTASTAEDKPASAAAPAVKTRTPGALFSGVMTLLSHPSNPVRRGMCGGVGALCSTPARPSSAGGAGAGSDAHAALPYALLHALFDRVRSAEMAAAPCLGCAASPSPLDTGAGDGPLGFHAATEIALSNGGKLLRAPSAASSAAAAAAASDDGPPAVVYGASLPPRLLQAALLSIVAPLPQCAPSATLAPEAAVAATLFLCCHPAVTGPLDDASLRSFVPAGQGLSEAATATSSSLAGPPGGGVVLSASALGGADARGRRAGALWRAAYTRLVVASGVIPSLDPAGEGGKEAGPVAGVARLVAPVALIDTLLQRECVGTALAAHLKGRWGVWSASHTNRVTAGRMAAALVRGTRWMCGRSRAQSSPSSEESGGGGAGGAGGRSVFIHALLPALVEALGDAVDAGVTGIDALVWAARPGSLAVVPDTTEQGMWREELGGGGRQGVRQPARHAREQAGQPHGGGG